MKGLFGGMFDRNHDGRLDAFERSAEMNFIDAMIKDKQLQDSTYSGEYIDIQMKNDYFEKISSPYSSNYVNVDDKINELELSGIDVDELEFMDEDEQREVFEDAGLDFDDYDFF